MNAVTLTSEQVAQASHIPDEQVHQDIADTEEEIRVMRAELAAFEGVPEESSEFRMAMFRAAHRRDGIREREAFIAKLQALLKAREKAGQP